MHLRWPAPASGTGIAQIEGLLASRYAQSRHGLSGLDLIVRELPNVARARTRWRVGLFV